MIDFDGAGPWLPQAENTTFYIDGFRSLLDFHLTLTPGLNVLVGPNGSGKTNFLDFLEFLSQIITAGSAAAVSSAGGISRVFSQENIRRASPRVRASISGMAHLKESANIERQFR